MLLRGALRRCPWCNGRGAFFTSWFAKAPACRTCGLRWRRDDVGFELGAAAMAALICIGPLVLLLGITLAVLWPEVPVIPLLATFLPGGLILPVALYPTSYTMWQAIDLLMRPASPEDFDVSHLDVELGADPDPA
jgi:uncharacterized protein (DUF983 family)